MAKLLVGTDGLRVRLSRGEKIGGMHGDVKIPMTQVREVEAVAEPSDRPWHPRSRVGRAGANQDRYLAIAKAEDVGRC